MMASYLGQFSHASAYRLVWSLFQRYWVLNRYFMLDNLTLRRADEPPRFYNLSSQYRWFCRKYENALIFFQVGKYFEFYRG